MAFKKNKQNRGSRQDNPRHENKGRPDNRDSRDSRDSQRPARHQSSESNHRSDAPRRSPEAPRRSDGPRRSEGPELGKNCYLMFGKHPVEAALNNPRRDKMRLWLTTAGQEALEDTLESHMDLPITIVDADTLSGMVHSDSPHQGVVMEVRRLGTVHLNASTKIVEGRPNIVLALDQVTDPHNIGAIMRSAVAFGAKAIITPDRHSPPETGVLAKSAAGMLELLPWVRVTNFGQALEELAGNGYWRVGLDGTATQELSTIDAGQNVVLVLGSEGKGMRDGTLKKCDFIAKLPINPKVESLNVSNAAAVALYELGRKK